MPNRILKESICTSESIDTLSLFQEVFYYRLIVNVDDYGRMDARIPILRSRLFPLKQISDAEIWEALTALQEQKIIDLYRVENCLYLQICSWEKHQRIRAKYGRCPPPVGDLLTSADMCCQMTVNDGPNKNTNTNTNTNSNSIRGGESAPAPTHAHAQEKKAYGSFGNVWLTDEEHEKLIADLLNAGELIEHFSKKLAAKGYKYDDHYAAILCWQEEDQQQKDKTQKDDGYWQDFFEAACNRTYDA